MKRLLHFALLMSVIGVWSVSCVKTETPKPRIAIGGIKIESSTFSPALSTEDMFRIRHGEDVMKLYEFLDPDSDMYQKAEWIPTMVASATPGGAVPLETYESLLGVILDSLRKNLPVDAFYFDIHGAMSVVGLDDPEGDMIVRIREVIGKEPIISTSMDLHGNVSWRLATNTDLITTYRMAPHDDAPQTRERAVASLLERLENGKGRPAYKAWIPVPILLPGEKTSTRVEPAKSLYAAVPPATAQEGVVDASIWIAYAWADEPRNHAVVMVTGDDKEVVARTAEDLARKFWTVRDQFEFVGPTGTLGQCLDRAIASDKKPFLISDVGDNPTAGGAGDVSWTLTELLKRKEFKSASGPSVIYASIPGPDLVAKAVEAGVGKKVEGYAGAMIDNRYAPPVKVSGTVEAIYQEQGNTQAVIKTGSLNVIVTEKRKPFHYEKDFTNLGLNPRETDIVIVKIGYLVPELYEMQKGWMMALTPGGVDQNLEGLEYKRIPRPMFPFDKDMDQPDLSARFVPAAIDQQ